MGWFDRAEFGPNVGLIDEMYRQYLDDPESVSEAWREFFAENEPDEPDEDGQAEEEPAEGRTEAEALPAAGAERPAPATPAEAPAKPAEKTAAKPAAKAEPKPAEKAAAKADADGKRDQTVPLRGAAARIVEAMEASRAVPTATSVRTVPAKLLEVNRTVLNGHLRRAARSASPTSSPTRWSGPWTPSR